MTNEIQIEPIHTLHDGRMSRTEAARYLGLSTKTLGMWALHDKGPRYVRVGGRIFYFKHDLDAFIQQGVQL